MKKALGLRAGLMMERAALKTVVSMIKDMEYQVSNTMSHLAF